MMAEKAGASHGDRGGSRILFAQLEGRILAVGIILFFACVVWASISLLWLPEHGKEILSLAATRFVVGRPGGVYFGHVLGVNFGVNISVNLFVDVIAVFFIYPLFVLGIENISFLHSLKKFIKRIHKTAQANYQTIKKYGILGLFLFVLCPLWGTGPVVGSVIGHMMGLRPWFNMGIVLGATLVAIVFWTVLLAEFHIRLAAWSVYMPMVAILILFIVSFGIHLGGSLRRKN